MKKSLLALVVGLGVLLSAGPSFAWHGHGHGHGGGGSFHFGVVIGGPGFACSPFYAPCGYYPPYYYGSYYYPGPYYGGGYYYSPYYSPYYAPPAFVNPSPPVYIEKSQGNGYWYYCAQSRKYYPYVKSCPEGWMKVVPQQTSPSNAPAHR